MKVGIIGAGHIGSILARDLQKLNHTVLIANSRGPETLTKVAQDTGAIPVSVSEAADGVDLLIITIPIQNVRLLPKDLLSRLPLKSPIIDTTNYYPPVSGHIDEIDGGMVEAEWVSQILGRRVIKAFNNIFADSLRLRGLPKGARNRLALAISGDNLDQKRVVMALVDAIGFEPFDAGLLSESWRYRPGTPAYCSDLTLKELLTLLKLADRQKAIRKRDSAGDALSKVILAYPQTKLVRILRLSAGLDTWKPSSWTTFLGLVAAIVRSKLGSKP